jgi:predicted nucleic acid-binding protein
LAPPPRYYLDTNVIIAIVETPRPLTAAQLRFVRSMDSGAVRAVTSELTLAETLVKPMSVGNPSVVRNYLSFLSGRTALRVVPVSRDIVIEAARLRAVSRAKLPDALHVATARVSRCQYLLTNDGGIKPSGTILVASWERLT